MLYGSYKHVLDQKGRLVIPSKFRKANSKKLFILKGFEGSLNVYGEENFKTYLYKLQNFNEFEKNARDVLRVALSSVVELEIDSKNRIQLPKEIINKYGIENSVTLVGMIDHFEIWNTSSWNDYFNENEKKFEDKSEDLLGGK